MIIRKTQHVETTLKWHSKSCKHDGIVKIIMGLILNQGISKVGLLCNIGNITSKLHCNANQPGKQDGLTQNNIINIFVLTNKVFPFRRNQCWINIIVFTKNQQSAVWCDQSGRKRWCSMLAHGSSSLLGCSPYYLLFLQPWKNVSSHTERMLHGVSFLRDYSHVYARKMRAW